MVYIFYFIKFKNDNRSNYPLSLKNNGFVVTVIFTYVDTTPKLEVTGVLKLTESPELSNV